MSERLQGEVRNVAILLLVCAMLTVWVATSQRHHKVYEFSSSTPDYTIQDLRNRSIGIYLVSARGSAHVHWNSADNRPWALDKIGVLSHIYRDQRFDVLEVVRGPQVSSLLIRGVGGTIEDYTLNYHDEPVVTHGERYLVFVYEADTPTREGSEQATALVLHGHGLFRQSSTGSWHNVAGKSIAVDLSELR